MAVESALTSERTAVIRADHLEMTYRSFLPSWLPFDRSVAVLDDVSIRLTTDEIVGIVGENGSGKSTLMKILAGVLDPTGGSVERNGRLGWCPQQILLYDRLTVMETFELFGKAYGLDDATIEERSSRLAERLGFEEYLDYRIEHLSGGNQQKVNLSVSLMHDPDLLLLDEPYTGFDWETYEAFWELSGELVEQGTGVVVISHLLADEDRFDRIYELDGGTLTEVEAHVG